MPCLYMEADNFGSSSFYIPYMQNSFYYSNDEIQHAKHERQQRSCEVGEGRVYWFLLGICARSIASCSLQGDKLE